ncbi:DUF6215 domain-containing protein [Streptomyces sp. P9(2023)]|uniref:DUF6215 domain-containing protein n=1 Tax=Streptomyces sp. P9(2023) TaxID=3064394 RepID=UPI0028F43E2A|nr:DUF6215 domain-containing protein [Streptomyces sp. P9(2023)]MDT9687258.1 DUF6215 domain-containing protein [Streptomyces sp. P9(2023)]
MADDIDALPKGAGVWGQTIAGLLLIPALGVGLWAYDQTAESAAGTGGARPAAACPGGGSEQPPTPASEDGAAPRVTGQRLCELLNRPDLAQLLGTPGEIAKSASGSDGFLSLGGGDVRDLTTPLSQVEFETYTVTLAGYDRLSVAGSEAGLLWGGAVSRTVLGHPAVLSTQSTTAISFSGEGSGAYSGAGVPARVLSVAKDAKDSGGSFELAMWREDGTVPDDSVMLRVAERVLPTVQGWADAAGR